MNDVCPQCGYIHPPLALGEKCPMAKNKASNEDFIEYESFLKQVKNIIASRIESKKIKDHKKLFSALLQELFKFLDKYEETWQQ